MSFKGPLWQVQSSHSLLLLSTRFTLSILFSICGLNEMRKKNKGSQTHPIVIFQKKKPTQLLTEQVRLSTISILGEIKTKTEVISSILKPNCLALVLPVQIKIRGSLSRYLAKLQKNCQSGFRCVIKGAQALG